MKSLSVLVVALATLCLGLPHDPQAINVAKRQSLSTAVTDFLDAVEPLISESDLLGVLAALESASAVASPSSVEDAAAAVESILTNDKPANIFEYVGELAINGLIEDTLLELAAGEAGELTEDSDVNPTNPVSPIVIYPKRSSCDAPYSLSETVLREAIYIPPTFTYGKKPPVILFPGTGNYGYETFAGSFIPLLTDVEWADPVWVNVPGRMLLDAQSNAEYAAYAANYINAITGQNVTLAAWSQGSVSCQWAVKYWPSTRSVISDIITFSGDYAGTSFADFLCPDGLSECNPSVWQQRYLTTSNFITALRSDNGDSAYVPTTNIYSGLYDEVVEPQQGTDASAYLNDVRGVGVSNNEVQSICSGYLAGTVYTHEGILFNPLSYALLKDAMANPGPGEPSRLDLPTVCSTYLTEGLGLGDFLLTEQAIAIAALGIIAGPKTASEPTVSAYATASPAATCA